MIVKNSVLIGSDFEHFIEDGDGKIISAIQFNEGTKQIPQKLDKEGCCIQRDGVLQECNVPPVELGGGEEFWDNVNYVRDYLEEKLGKDGLKLKCCASATLDDDQMQDPEANVLGCDPDFNAWEEGAINTKPRLREKNFRTCGCHFHMSFEEDGEDYNPKADTVLELVKLFDLFVTVPFVLIDEDIKRRKLYGKAGSFRPCSWSEDVHGVEFRQLSNKCLQNKELVLFIFNQLEVIIDHFNEHGLGSIDKDKKKIVDCINKSDRKLAAKLLKTYNVGLPLEFIDNEDVAAFA